MMQSEWEQMTGQPTTIQEWDVVHTVYQWHPMIGDVDGKKQLLALYKLGGIGLLRDMLTTANRAYELSSHEDELDRQIEALDAEKVRVMQEFDEKRRQIVATRHACRQAQREMEKSFTK